VTNRHRAKMDDKTRPDSTGYRFIGKPLPRKEDARLIIGRGGFAGDFSLPGEAHAVMVRRSHAQRIASTEMRHDLLAHQLQRARDFVVGKSTAAIDLGEHAAETERAGHLRKPSHHGVRRPDDHLVAQYVGV
jgi:CO/xanthine dehydrogenase Mo-binding subunit